jgi:hypothetical protein
MAATFNKFSKWLLLIIIFKKGHHQEWQRRLLVLETKNFIFNIINFQLYPI